MLPKSPQMTLFIIAVGTPLLVWYAVIAWQIQHDQGPHDPHPR